jgi:hypothetical protein
VWQAAVLFAALAAIAGGSCAGFVSNTSGPAGSVLAIVFAVTAPIAAGAFALLLFRIWRRQHAEAWPSVGQAVLMIVAGGGLAFGGCGGFAAMNEALWPMAVALGVLFVLGMALATGAAELLVVSIARLIFKRPGAR